jgi:hypothetical protein
MIIIFVFLPVGSNLIHIDDKVFVYVSSTNARTCMHFQKQIKGFVTGRNICPERYIWRTDQLFAYGLLCGLVRVPVQIQSLLSCCSLALLLVDLNRLVGCVRLGSSSSVCTVHHTILPSSLGSGVNAQQWIWCAAYYSLFACLVRIGA